MALVNKDVATLFQWDEDVDLQMLKTYIIGGWPHTKYEVEPDVERCWPIRHELVIDGVAMKGK